MALLAENSSAPRIEPVGPEQAELLAELFQRNDIPAITETFDPFPLTAEQSRRIAVEPRLDQYFLALLDERPVGLSMLRGFDEGYAIPSFGIFIDHESHGHGLGRRLTRWTIEAARDRACPAVRLSVYDGNRAAQNLYASLGFEELERQTVERGGRELEKIVMTLDLGD